MGTFVIKLYSKDINKCDVSTDKKNLSLCLFGSGHLPVKLPDYNNRLRVLVATYVTFSPDGTELLVNMGGEQVMLLWANNEQWDKLLISGSLLKCLLCLFIFMVF